MKYQGLPAVYLASEFRNDADDADDIPPAATSQARNKLLDLVVLESADVSSAEETTGSDSDSDDSATETAAPSKPAKKMIEDERREVGRVGLAVWALYLGANGGTLYFMTFAAVFLGSKFANVGESLWLAIWSRSYDTSTVPQLVAPHTVYYYLGIYAGMRSSSIRCAP